MRALEHREGFSPPPPAANAVGLADSGLGRVAAVLWKPRQTFASIAARPTWAAALLVILLATALSTAFWVPKIDVDEMIRDRIAESGQSIPADRLDSSVELMDRLKWVMFLGPVVVLQPIFMAVAAFAFYLVFRVLGSAQSYRQSFAVVVHAFLPLAVAALLAVPVLLGRDSISTEELMGGGILASNLGFLAVEDGPPWMGALLQSLDFFSLWTLVLLVIGYRQTSRASNPTVAIAVLSLWGVWILIRVGMAYLASLAT